jgi:CDP-diacylglycerol--serine O-phosphatidyltransferase
MIIVKKEILGTLKVSINSKLFGANKTYRGLLVVTIFTAIFQYLVGYMVTGVLLSTNLFLGAILGLTYILCELPNSFIKRKAGIPSGGKSVKNKYLFMIMDKSDSALGVSLIFVLIKQLALIEFFKLFFIAFALHTLISVISVKIKLKESF